MTKMPRTVTTISLRRRQMRPPITSIRRARERRMVSKPLTKLFSRMTKKTTPLTSKARPAMRERVSGVALEKKQRSPSVVKAMPRTMKLVFVLLNIVFYLLSVNLAVVGFWAACGVAMEARMSVSAWMFFMR